MFWNEASGGGLSLKRGGAILCLALFAVACGGGDAGGTPTDPQGGGTQPPPGGGTGPVATTSVQVLDSSFSPAAILVQPGATVTWTWGGSQQHNVIWAAGNLTNSPTQSAGTHQVTMPSAAGELVYYCSLHGSPAGGMRGTVRIQ